MAIEELRELCALTVELTKLRQNECKHLCIENFAPELLGKLIRERQGLGAQPMATCADHWPIARLEVAADGSAKVAAMYTPGLPEGYHDVWPCPVAAEHETPNV